MTVSDRSFEAADMVADLGARAEEGSVGEVATVSCHWVGVVGSNNNHVPLLVLALVR